MTRAMKSAMAPTNQMECLISSNVIPNGSVIHMLATLGLARAQIQSARILR